LTWSNMLINCLVTAGEAIWFFLPAYFANATPVVLGGGTPIDLGRNFLDGRRILGAIALTAPVVSIPLSYVIAIVVVTPPIHLGTNALAHVLKLKEKPW